MPRLYVVICSVREQRGGAAVAEWFAARAAAHGGFEVETVDLKAVALPMLPEPNHPFKRRYTLDSTRAWSERISRADAFVFVTPEYNHGTSPALLNALDHLFHEWNYKPAGFVSYGGEAGGARSVEMIKNVLTTLRMMPIPEAVVIPKYANYRDESGRFDPGDAHDKSIASLLGELARWTTALQTLRS